MKAIAHLYAIALLLALGYSLISEISGKQPGHRDLPACAQLERL